MIFNENQSMENDFTKNVFLMKIIYSENLKVVLPMNDSQRT
jgi:hypothetical protein